MYQEDLAFIHAAGFGDVAAAAARMLQEEAPRRGRVVDLGCGPGILLEAMMDAGFSGWGVDVSPHMVALAAKRVPRATLAVAPAQDVPLPPCVAVAATGEVMNHVAAEADVPAVIHRIWEALEPGGVLLFDVATHERTPSRSRRSGRGWRVEARVDVAGGILTRTIDTWRTVGAVDRHSREVHRIGLLDADRLGADLAAAGFVVERLGGYDDYAFQPGWDGFLARKPD